MSKKPVALLDPSPRSLELMFRPDDLKALRETVRLLPENGEIPAPEEVEQILPEAEFVIGQTDLPKERLDLASKLKAIFNVEGNFLPNIDYDSCFQRGIRVLNVSPVFAQPVAELGLTLALDLARGVTANHVAFSKGEELYGLASNAGRRLLLGSRIGILGYGALGRALHNLLIPFKPEVIVHDPWLPEAIIEEANCTPVAFDEIFRTADVLFVTAAVTTENLHAISSPQLDSMVDDSILVLLSRAAVADFPALINAARSGRIKIATDVFPEEPVPPTDPLRESGILLSGHRAGDIDWAFKEMGHYLVTDLGQMVRGLPPVKCAQALPETVCRLRSRPVKKS